MKQNLILIGYMGCGKTTVGKAMSQKLGLKFCDTDHLIEKKEKCSIREIFAEYGEEYFRTLETRLLEQLIHELKNTVLSTGGGLPIRECNAKLLKRLGTVIYLKTSSDIIYERVKYDQSRPLLQCEDPKRKIEEMLCIREPYYKNAADLIIDTSNHSVDEVIEIIKCRVEQKNKERM